MDESAIALENELFAPEPPFLLRAEPQLQESLPSLLCRVATLNGYSPSNLILQVCEQRLVARGIRDNLSQPRQPTTYAVLAQALQVEPLTLYAGTLHPWASCLAVDSSTIRSMSLAHQAGLSLLPVNTGSWHPQIRLDHDSGYCPVCLDEQAYGRIHWQLCGVTMCLRHNQLLLVGCPHCQHPLPVAALLRGRCDECWYRLKDGPHCPIPMDQFGYFAQCVVQHWLNLAPAPISMSWWKRLPPWKNYQAYQLVWRLSERLVYLVDKLTPFWGTLKLPQWPEGALAANASAQRYCALSLAVQGLLDWPYAFFELLDLLASGALHSLTPSQLLAPLWKQSSFEFLHQVIEQYRQPLDSSGSHQAKRRRLSMRAFQAAPSSCSSLASVQRLASMNAHLLEAKQLLPQGTVQGSMPPYLFRREDMGRLLRICETPVTFRRAATWLGLPCQLVECLAKEREFGSLVKDKHDWRVKGDGVLSWLDQMLDILHSQSTSRFPITLTEAESCLRPFGQTDVSLILNAKAGGLAAWLPGDTYDLRGLRFDELALFRFAIQASSTSGLILKQDVAKQLQVPVVAVDVWQRREWLRAQYLAQIEVLTFELFDILAFLYYFAAETEVLKLFRGDRATLQRQIQTGNLHPHSGPGYDASPAYLFARAEINRLASSLPGGRRYRPSYWRWRLIDYENYARRKKICLQSLAQPWRRRKRYASWWF